MSQGKPASFLKQQPSVALKLESMCAQLTHEFSVKAMAELRDCVLAADPPLSPEKLVEIFLAILADTLAKQQEAFEEWRADPQNMTAMEYVRCKLGKAARSINSFLSTHSGKIMPVVDFLLGTDESDDEPAASPANPPETSPSADAVISIGDDRLRRDRVIDLNPNAIPLEDLNINDNQDFAHCSVQVANETRRPASHREHPYQVHVNDEIHRVQPNLFERALTSQAVKDDDGNANNSADTDVKEDENDKNPELPEEYKVKIRAKKRRLRGKDAVSTKEVFVNVAL
ncbi:uncharacterized protein [Diadema setosum]|uniref:uncharacterized protein n=1 Tax=Diadema setosum TaxID=31175 RepID=UPI003B3B67D6